MAIICTSPLTYARQRPITASHSSRHDMLAIISSRYQYGPFLFFVADVMSNYSTTDGLKKFSLLPEAPLRPEGRGIRHICHMVNSALHKPVVLGVAAASGVARNFRQGVRQSVAFLSVHSRSAALPSRPYNQKTHIKSHMPKMYFPDKPLTPLVWQRHCGKPPIFTCLPLIAPYFSGYSTGCLATPHAWPR